MPDETSVEQRSARIRGRMQWILQQVEGGSFAGDAAAKHVAALERQQLSHEAQLEDELSRQAERLRAEHDAELTRQLAQLRAIHATEVRGLRAQLRSAREEAALRHSAAAANEAERQRTAAEAERREQMRTATARVALLEAALAKVAPFLPAVLEELARSHGSPQLLGQLHVRQAPASLEHPKALPSRWAAAEAKLASQPPPSPARPATGAPQPTPAAKGATPCSLQPQSAATKSSSNPPPKKVGSLSLPPGPKAVPPPPPVRPTRGEMAAAPPAAVQVAPKGVKMSGRYVGYSHPGGSKPVDAVNQDTWFVHELDEHNMLFAVFDGHGPENGAMVAQVAAQTVRDYVVSHFNALRSEPESVFTEAFELAHKAALDAVLQACSPPTMANEDFRLVDGVPIATWTDEDGVQQAEVGDSIGLLGGTIAASEDGEVTFEELMAEHSASNVDEYSRVQSHPQGHRLQFVYDTPGLIDEGKAPAVFKKVNGAFQLDVGARRLAEVHNTVAKNARGDLPTIILTPEEPGFEQQSLAMTRSIGDFYLQRFGISWKPEVICVELAEVGSDLSNLTLVIASDGVWDLWHYEDVFEGVVQRYEPDGLPDMSIPQEFFERSIERGIEMFDDTADNMTGIVVYFKDAGSKHSKSCNYDPAGPASSPSAAPPSSFFSV
ncbi:hypothetical protein AB1Y20_003661 [Prymnesium parvum]|uniref:PPM-type phosphatase domain-containing protein n=1 Tax=Prymnesium parvum TaxID=97485 RepID=A0AB34J599_PRYPA